MVDLAGIDQVFALAPADIDAVPFVAVEREACDRKRLALRARYLQPVIAAAGSVAAIPNLGDDALEADGAGVLEHLSAVDLKTLANWTSVSATSFLRTAFRSYSASSRRSYLGPQIGSDLKARDDDVFLSWELQRQLRSL